MQFHTVRITEETLPPAAALQQCVRYKHTYVGLQVDVGTLLQQRSDGAYLVLVARLQQRCLSRLTNQNTYDNNEHNNQSEFGLSIVL